MNAETTINQLGGFGKLKAMVGAHNFLKDSNWVSFKFKGSKNSNYVKITLEADDTYTVEFWKVFNMNRKTFEIKKPKFWSAGKGLYADMLIREFETTTGLYLSL